MLALSRKLQEAIIIGSGPTAVVVTIGEIDRGKVKLLIDAPAGISVDRVEVRHAKEQEAARLNKGEGRG